MSKSFTLNQLTEGIRDRNVGAEGRRLTDKWTRTGLLRGLDDHGRESKTLSEQARQQELPQAISEASLTLLSQSFVEFSAVSFLTSSFQSSP